MFRGYTTFFRGCNPEGTTNKKSKHWGYNALKRGYNLEQKHLERAIDRQARPFGKSSRDNVAQDQKKGEDLYEAFLSVSF